MTIHSNRVGLVYVVRNPNYSVRSKELVMGSKVVMELCGCPECDCQYVGAGSECKKCLVKEHHTIDGLPHWLIVEHIPYEPTEWKVPNE